MTQPEDNFIGRWSRRKREHVKEANSSQPEDVELAVEAISEAGNRSGQEIGYAERTADVTAAEAADEQLPSTESAPLTDADMVALDTLDADSDYAPFMSEGVSSELRKAALKKLFFSGKFAARDGLDDYDDDFTKFEPLGDTVTSDMKFHARRKEKARLAKLEEERLALEAQNESASEGNTEPLEAQNTDGPTAEPDQTNPDQTNPDQTNQKTPKEQNADDTRAPAEEPAQPDIQHSSLEDDHPDSGKTA